MAINAELIKNIIPETIFLHAPLTGEFNCSIDSRSISNDEIFVAIKGNRVDGHDFLQNAFERGARGCIIALEKKDILNKIDQRILSNKIVILVPDTKEALIKLAIAVRSEFKGDVVCITGSIGKTSTKETLAGILDLEKISYLASKGTQNTVLGVALTLVRLKSESLIVLELGISKRGEMAQLVAIAQPTIGVITAVGHSHMEGLGSINDIASEKRDIFRYFKEDNIGIVNGDQPLLAQVGYRHPVIKFGLKTTNQVQARKIQVGSDSITFSLKLYGTKYKITLPSNHKGAIFHSLAAAAIAYLLKIPAQTIISAIEKKIIVSGRFEQRLLKNGKGILINDCYNASPESMKAALAALQQMQTQAHKVAVLGDMLELGVNSAFWHRQIGRYLRKVPSIRDVILVGSHVEAMKKTLPLGIKVDVVPSWKEAVEKLNERISQESCILIKGSRGISLDNLVDEFS